MAKGQILGIPVVEEGKPFVPRDVAWHIGNVAASVKFAKPIYQFVVEHANVK